MTTLLHVPSLVLAFAVAALGSPRAPVPPGDAACHIDGAEATEGVVAVFDVGGGIAGRADHYVIHADGTIDYTDLRPHGRRRTLAHPGGVAAATRLAKTIDGSGVLKLPQGCYASAAGGDRQTYKVVVRRAGTVYRFAGMDEGMPRALAESVHALMTYVGALPTR